MAQQRTAGCAASVNLQRPSWMRHAVESRNWMPCKDHTMTGKNSGRLSKTGSMVSKTCTARILSTPALYVTLLAGSLEFPARFRFKRIADNPIICCSHQNRNMLRSIKDYRHCKSHLLNGLEKFILVGITGLHRLIQLLKSQNMK